MWNGELAVIQTDRVQRSDYIQSLYDEAEDEEEQDEDDEVCRSLSTGLIKTRRSQRHCIFRRNRVTGTVLCAQADLARLASRIKALT